MIKQYFCKLGQRFCRTFKKDSNRKIPRQKAVRRLPRGKEGRRLPRGKAGRRLLRGKADRVQRKN